MIIKRSILIIIVSLAYIMYAILFSRLAEGNNLISGMVATEILDPGDNLETDFELINIGGSKTENVSLFYAIKDFEGKVLLSNKENLTTEGNINFSRTLKIPENISNGVYILYSKVSHRNGVSSSSDLFEIRKEETEMPKPPNLIILFVIGGFVMLIILILFTFKYRNKK